MGQVGNLRPIGNRPSYDHEEMRFEFAAAGRIVFGPGTVAELPEIAGAFGRRALVVTGKDRIRHAGVIASLEQRGFQCTIFGVSGEPTVALVREGAQVLRESASDVVIAIGGGSAIDAGKAIAALGPNPSDVLEYLEIIGKGKPLDVLPCPFIAIPTTAGTGSEVTRNAVLGSPEHGVKASLRSPWMLPRVAIVDPDLTLALPPTITAYTGMDALTQLIEPYVSCRANPFTDALCRDGCASWPVVLRGLTRTAATPRRGPGCRMRACSAGGAGQCGTGRSAWFRGSRGRHVQCAAWSCLRGHSGAWNARQYSGITGAGSGERADWFVMRRSPPF